MAETTEPKTANAAATGTDAAPGAERPALETLRADPPAKVDATTLEGILDIPIKLSMEIGKTRISIRNLLQLNRGSVVELDRAAGEPLDVMANGVLVAHGEVVVVNERFGIRLTDVVSPHERLSKLR